MQKEEGILIENLLSDRLCGLISSLELGFEVFRSFFCFLYHCFGASLERFHTVKVVSE